MHLFALKNSNRLPLENQQNLLQLTAAAPFALNNSATDILGMALFQLLFNFSKILLFTF